MLTLVTGRSGSGKTEYVRDLLREKAKAGDKKLMLIVPEQFSYSCERAFLETLEAGAAQNIEVLSFTRLSDFVSRHAGGIRGVRLDDADKTVLMMHALNLVRDELRFYALQSDKTYFATDLIVLFSEFRKEKVTAEALENASLRTDKKVLSDKLHDLALILRTFDTMLERNGFTDGDLITTQVIKSLRENRLLEGYTVCIDAFKGFTAQESEIIEVIGTQADDVYVSLCLDPALLDTDRDPTMIFGAVKHTYDRLVKTADGDVRTVVCRHSRFENDALRFLEANLFSATEGKYMKKTPEEENKVTLFTADTKYDECNFIAASIRKLLREENYRLRDIAVVTRNEDSYRNELVAALERFEIPVYEDRRQPVANQPLVTLCKALISIMSSREITTRDVLTFIKTGFSPLTEEETEELENYVYTWNIKTGDWGKPFTGDPQGVTPEKDEEAIGNINASREKILYVLNELRSGLDTAKAGRASAVPAVFSEKIFRFISLDFVKSRFTAFAKALNDAGLSDLAAEQNRIFEVITDILDKLATIEPDNEITLKVYGELFSAACDMATIGTLPHGLDELTIGSADRIRLSNPKAVFVCGLIEGEFPKNISTGGMLTGNDRKTLSLDLGLTISLGNALAACDERFIAYAAVTAPTDRLFVSYHTKAGAGEALSPSPLFEEIRNRFADSAQLAQSDLDAYFFSETEGSSFATFATGWHKRSEQNVVSYNTIKAALSDCPDLSEKFRLLDSLTGMENKGFEDKDLAVRLFGKDIYTSASRVETFYNCPFQFFCRYGLKVYPRKRVELSSQIRGSAIHYVLEKLLKNCYGEAGFEKEKFTALTQKEQEKAVSGLLKDYLKEQNIDDTVSDARFSYEYKSLVRTMTDILARMIEEFKVSDFSPEGFEHHVDFTLETDEAEPVTLRLSGDIDRVDVFTAEDGTKYLRVVDYKSYVKEFRLDHVLAGLNMQMLIYLFAAGKKGAFAGSSPAAILYYKAKKSSGSFGTRDLTPEEIFDSKISGNLSSGMYLDNDTVLNAMEHGKAGRFYPLCDSRGNPLENLVTLEEMGSIEELVNRNLSGMAKRLHEGDIRIHPVYGESGATDGCKYCDYANVCGFEPALFERNTLSKKKKNEVLCGKDGEQNA